MHMQTTPQHSCATACVFSSLRAHNNRDHLNDSIHTTMLSLIMRMYHQSDAPCIITRAPEHHGCALQSHVLCSATGCGGPSHNKERRLRRAKAEERGWGLPNQLHASYIYCPHRCAQHLPHVSPSSVFCLISEMRYKL